MTRFHVLALSAILALQGASAFAVAVTGAGSTFVYPVLAKWADAYKKKTGNSVNYQSIGSGGGIKQIKAKTVDFGATDMPLKDEELEKDGLVQFPIVNGALVAVINVPGIKADEVTLTGEVIADIFLGKVKTWNDPAIAKMNAGVKLPATAITVVHRSDGSGSSFIWTNYLSKVSADWKSKVGEGSAVEWPVGVGGKGNEGMAANVKQVEGSIGYVEYAYALQNEMATVKMKNAAGKTVKATSESFAAAAAGADWSKAKNYNLILTNAPGAGSWPVAGSTFVVMRKDPANVDQAKEAMKFFKWVYENGTDDAKKLHYVPVAAKVTKLVEKTWNTELKSLTGKM